MSRSRKALFGLLAAQFALADMGNDGVGVVTWADQPPNGDSLQLTLTNSSGQPNPIQYNVVPIVEQGLDGSDSINQTVVIDGILVAVDQSNFHSAMEPDAVAYLSCDRPPEGTGDTYITADVMLNGLIDSSVKAIVLYSQVKNGCVLGNTGSLRYWSILSMTDAGDAQQVLSYLNATATGRMQVSISGNASQPDLGGPFASQGSSSNSAVAMSILYSITGLIALLFLIIIGTGAVRAHRYPERYGPRVAVAGRPRQSRAKGLARAVLDTIPIVKFGNSQRTSKPDPEMELDATTTDGRDAGAGAVAQRVVSSHPTTEDSAAEATPALAAEDGDDGSQAEADSQRQNDEGKEGGEEADGSHLGCSICTEDFKVGEDMRVLPCNHQFHPNCIDPWLVNVSGTCPLCRLDLRRPARPLPEGSSVNRSSTLPPPLPLESEGSDEAGSSASNRRDSHRLRGLRQASAEEQMAALRAMGRRGEAAADGEERGSRARLTVRLRERFRIRTRASPGNE